LIREFGEVISFEGEKLSISSTLEPNIGDSIAINGACLTVIQTSKEAFAVELSKETQKVVATENYTKKVHLEPAMRLNDRVEGHLVQGHIDSIGVIDSIVKNSNSYDVYIKLQDEAFLLAVPKGSIAVDGVSLTINSINKSSKTIRLTIIPHTFKNTLFATYKKGIRVNIESDMMVRTIFHLKQSAEDGKNWEFFDRMHALY
ncbi:MAG: riboflavin synthase, partial [Campylobacterales bacterium]